jgi:hypothetical protein
MDFSAANRANFAFLDLPWHMLFHGSGTAKIGAAAGTIGFPLPSAINKILFGHLVPPCEMKDVWYFNCTTLRDFFIGGERNMEETLAGVVAELERVVRPLRFRVESVSRKHPTPKIFCDTGSEMGKSSADNEELVITIIRKGNVG